MFPMEDLEYNNILNFVTTKKYPKILKSGRHSNWRKKCRKYESYDGVLFFNNRKVIKKSQKLEIIETLHDNHGEHFGRNKTRMKICKKYYWKTITEDVEKFVASCKHCSEKSKQKLLSRELVEQLKPPAADVDMTICSLRSTINDIKTLPNVIWELDIIGPLENKTYKGNQCILLMIHKHHRWIEAKSIENKGSTECIAKFIIQILFRYSFIGYIQISQFICSKDEDFCSRLSANLLHLGLTEENVPNFKIVNNLSNTNTIFRTLFESYCMQYINNCKYLWDKILHAIVFSYNTYDINGSSPHSLLYNHPPILHLLSDGCEDYSQLWKHTSTLLQKFNITCSPQVTTFQLTTFSN